MKTKYTTIIIGFIMSLIAFAAVLMTFGVTSKYIYKRYEQTLEIPKISVDSQKGLAHEVTYEKFRIEVRGPKYVIKKDKDGKDIIEISNSQDFGNFADPGRPKLPRKLIRVAIPPDSTSVNVMFRTRTAKLEGKYNIKIAGKVYPMKDDKYLSRIFTNEYIENYKSTHSDFDRFFPLNPVCNLGVDWWRKYLILVIEYCPFQLKGKEKELWYTDNIDLEIKCTRERIIPEHIDLNDSGFSEIAKEMIYNYYNALQKWYSPSSQIYVNWPRYGEIAEPYDYLILCSEVHLDAIRDFVDFKRSLGYKVKVVTEEWIDERDDSFFGFGPYDVGPFGFKKKFRYYLLNNYLRWGLKYVLIVGDRTIIPIQSLTIPSEEPDRPYEINTDLYYADMSWPDYLSWDTDCDGIYGEPEDDRPIRLCAHYINPELSVGRILCAVSERTASALGYDLEGFFQKSIDFERDTGWRKSWAMMLAGITHYPDNRGHDYKNDMAEVVERICDEGFHRGWTMQKMYEREGVSPSEYTSHSSLTYENVETFVLGGRYALLQFGMHGRQGGESPFPHIYRYLWVTDTDPRGRITEEAERSFPNVFTDIDIGMLDDNYPAVIYFDCCEMAMNASNVSLVAGILNNGAVGVIAPTHDVMLYGGWRNVDDGYSQTLQYLWSKHYMSDKDKLGDALMHAKIDYFENYHSGTLASLWNLYTLNCFGDPSLYGPGYDIEE